MLRSLHRRPRARAWAPALGRLTGGLVAAPREPDVPTETEPTVPTEVDPTEVWFEQHFHEAADQVMDFLAGAGLTLEGKMVADVGCGDGIIDLGLALRGRPQQLVGYDLNPTQADVLLDQARRFAGVEALPPNLTFTGSEPERIDAPDAQFDVVVTWSAFEHVNNPESLLRELRRIMRPSGVLFLQLWPFYHSAQGSHLWDWFPEPFHHLQQDDEDIAAGMRASDRHPQEWVEYMLSEYRSLNGITVDDLHAALKAAGFSVRQFELMSHRTYVPPGLDEYPLSTLGVSGVKLLAAPV